MGEIDLERNETCLSTTSSLQTLALYLSNHRPPHPMPVPQSTEGNTAGHMASLSEDTVLWVSAFLLL